MKRLKTSKLRLTLRLGYSTVSLADSVPWPLSNLITFYLKGFAMPPTPFLGSGASFQGPGPLPMASARRAIGISLIESFWRAIGAEIEPFS